MEEVLRIVIEGIMDAIEEFFSAVTVPTKRYTLYAFFVSLGFLAWSVCAKIFELATFVDWQEAVTGCILMLIIVLIDSSTRSTIQQGLWKIKEASNRFTYSGEDVEEQNDLVGESMPEEFSEYEEEVRDDKE